MVIVYDTRSVRPHLRYEHYREGTANETAPVVVDGPPPGRLFATMSTAAIGVVELSDIAWVADTAVTALRTQRLIRASDPECYRICLCVNGSSGRSEQAGNQVGFRARDIALFDVSLPWMATNTSGRLPMRRIMLTFPHAATGLDPIRVRPYAGTVLPRKMPGRGSVAQFLIELAETVTNEEITDPTVVQAVHECAVGLIRQRLRQPNGITTSTRRLLHTARIRTIIRRNLADPTLNTEQIAEAANMSPRYLHKILHDSGHTPMQLLKQLRLEQCRRSLRDRALSTKPIKEIISAYGYLRADQFARDFKQLFGDSATQVRELAQQEPLS